jgi:hypothetical protein
MDYPEWAPKYLIDFHRKITSPEKEFRGHNPESIIADVLKKHGSEISDENLEDMRRQLYRGMLFGGLPENEEISLLEKLISDQNMKSVWTTLSKRYTDEWQDPRQFFDVCQRGITGWRGDLKQTPAERREFYQEIYDTVLKLWSLMNKASAFDDYSISGLIKDDSIEWLRDVLDMPDIYSQGDEMELSYVKSCLSEITPQLYQVIEDIAETSKKYRDEAIVVKKPNSQNAGAHFFINTLSHYCRKTYGQPLNEVVAITASVVFDLQNCDEAYVRKIVKT